MNIHHQQETSLQKDRDTKTKKEYIKPTIWFIASTLLIQETIKDLAEKILNRNIVFGPEEYKILSSDDLKILREYKDSFIKEDERTIKFITDFWKLFSNQIHKKYPDGFIFVAVGRSPAFLAKHLEFQGEEVKYCPISSIGCKPKTFSHYFVNAYKKYLDIIGLTKEFTSNSKKPIIITDYTYEGYSLRNFRELLAHPEIGITESENVRFSPITRCGGFYRENSIFNDCPTMSDDYQFLRKEEWDFPDNLYNDIMSNMKHKKYSSVPNIKAINFEPQDYYDRELKSLCKNWGVFEEDFKSKMMNFIVADEINNEK